MALAVAAALIAAAWAMDAAWADRHILPSFFVARSFQLGLVVAARALLIAGAVAVLAFAPPALRNVGPLRLSLMVAAATASATAAIVCTELVLRLSPWQAFQARSLEREPQRRRDPRYGWTHLPSHSGLQWIGNRWVDYAFDSHGYRVPAAGLEVDVTAPSIVFSGESLMLGFGLTWPETVAARVAVGTGLQPANLAVTGFATDQALLRLGDELPKFRCPVAVVSVFMPSFLDRNLNTDRPHFDADLRLLPPRTGSRLAATLRHAIGYRSSESVERGIAMTTTWLLATRRVARARRARWLLVVPTFMPESRAEQAIRRRILDDAGIDYAFVPVDAGARIRGDAHPSARGTAVIAAAILDRLRSDGIGTGHGGRPCAAG
ncbi:MAG: hypothetical protein JF593_04355 [Novosphingobium sp.]|nr:hypothetical protein [Novosphingobium sp.]